MTTEGILGGMMLAGLTLCTVLGTLNAKAEEDELKLPHWEQDEVQIFPLGGSLLPQASPATPQEQAAQDEMRSLDIRAQGEAGGKRSGEAEHLVEVDADFFERLEGVAGGGFIFDPGGCLEGGASEELGRMLDSHAQRARIEVRVVVLNGKQQLPKQVDVSKVGGANLMSGLGCVVVYPVGEPWRVRLFMSRRVTEVVKQDYLRNLARACIQEAVKSSEGLEQLQRFVNQLSIRLTWLEREHDLPEAPDAEGVALPAAASIPFSTAGGGDAGVTEVGMQVPAEKHLPWWTAWWGSLKVWVWKGAAGLVVLAALWMLGRWLRRRFGRRKKVVAWILPEVQVRPRLGGKHCGGGGAAVRY